MIYRSASANMGFFNFNPFQMNAFPGKSCTSLYSFNGSLYALGGRGDGRNTVKSPNSTYQYDQYSDWWFELAPLNEQRNAPGMFFIDFKNNEHLL